MDVIFCRNVLLYFTTGSAKKALEKFYHCLADEGYLIVSPSEASPTFNHRFVPAGYSQCGSIYRKNKEGEELARTEGPPAPWFYTPLALPTSEIKLDAVIADSPRQAAPPGQGYNAEAGERQTLEAGRNAAAANIKLARMRAGEGKLAEAVRLCGKAISSDKLNPAHYYLLATILHEQGQVEEAANYLKRALYLDPDFVLAHFAMGNLMLRLGKRDESARYFKNALSLLRKYRSDEVLPESDGFTAGHLAEAIERQVKEPV